MTNAERQKRYRAKCHETDVTPDMVEVGHGACVPVTPVPTRVWMSADELARAGLKANWDYAGVCTKVDGVWQVT